MELGIISLAIEIIGAAGVVASLKYLSIQIKHSNKVARSEMIHILYLA